MSSSKDDKLDQTNQTHLFYIAGRYQSDLFLDLVLWPQLGLPPSVGNAKVSRISIAKLLDKDKLELDLGTH